MREMVVPDDPTEDDFKELLERLFCCVEKVQEFRDGTGLLGSVITNVYWEWCDYPDRISEAAHEFALFRAGESDARTRRGFA